MASGPTITAKFLADTSELTNGIDKATSTASGKMSGFAKTAAVAVGGAFVADKVLDFGKASVEAAAADAEAQSKLAAALKSTAGATDAQVAGAENFISKLSQSAAIADDDLRPALSTLARGFKDTGKAQDALTLATDVAAGTGKDLSTVTEAMMKAANGQTGALGRLGIATKDANGHALSLDEIMGNLATTFKGQASTAANSTAGQMRKAKIAMGEMQETIGAALIPIIGKLAGFLNGTLFPALTSVFGWLMDHKAVIVAAVIGIGAVVLPLFLSWAVAAGAAAVATIAAAAPFILIGAAVAALAYLIISNWDTIKAATQAAFDLVLGIIQGVWHWISENWPLLLAILTGPIGLAVDFIVQHWDTILNAIKGVWNWLQGTWSSVTGFITGPIQSAVDWIAGVPETVLGFFRGLVTDIGDVFTDIGSAISGAFKVAFNAVAGFWNRTVGSIGFTVPSWVPGVGGKGFSIPDIPTLATGGMITSTGLVFAHAGEVIAPIEKVPGFGGGAAIHIEYATFNDPVDVELLARQLEFALSAGLPV